MRGVGPSLVAALAAALGSFLLAFLHDFGWLAWGVLFGEIYVLVAVLLFQAEAMEARA